LVKGICGLFGQEALKKKVEGRWRGFEADLKLLDAIAGESKSGR
jgi:hypothetical protein